MKKLIVLAGAVLICLLCLFSSCGGEEIQDASARADRMVHDWDRAALNLYRYSGRDIDYDGHDGYMVVMAPDDSSFASPEALREYQARETVAQCAGAVYEQLAECFSQAGEVYIIIAVCNGDGKTIFTFLNGELQK